MWLITSYVPIISLYLNLFIFDNIQRLSFRYGKCQFDRYWSDGFWYVIDLVWSNSIKMTINWDDLKFDMVMQTYHQSVLSQQKPSINAEKKDRRTGRRIFIEFQEYFQWKQTNSKFYFSRDLIVLFSDENSLPTFTPPNF